MRRSELFAARNAAGLQGSESLAKFNAGIARQHAAGIERGGPACCGTTGIWHQPWCPIGPWEPEPGEAITHPGAGMSALPASDPVLLYLS